MLIVHQGTLWRVIRIARIFGRRCLLGRHPLVHELVDGRDLVLAKVIAAQVTLHFFEVVDDVCDVLLLEVLFGVLGQHLHVEVIEDLLRLYLWLLRVLTS